jgi:hypothetical protein
MLQLAKHVLAKFQLSSFQPDKLRQIFDHFSSKFQNFLMKIQKISNSEKVPNRDIVNQNLSHLAFLQKF